MRGDTHPRRLLLSTDIDREIDISATFEGGALRPDHQLDLPEGSKVRATIHAALPTAMTPAQALDEIKRLRAGGAFRSGGRTFTRTEMHERR